MHTKGQKMYVVLDTETTGLYSNRHEMIAYCGIKLDKNLNEIGRLHIKIKPINISQADPNALKINGYTQNKWSNAKEPKEAAHLIANFMRDCVPVAHNWPFDRGFIVAHLSKYAHGRKILRRGIDTVSLASAVLLPMGYKSVSMQSIANIFNWPTQTHNALDDTLYCVQLFRLLYPYNARNVIKVRALVYCAKIGMYINPMRGKHGPKS